MEEYHFPKPAVQYGVTATIVQQIWALRILWTSPATIRDCSMIVFSFCMNEIPQSSVWSITNAYVDVDIDQVTTRLSFVNNKDSGVSSLKYKRISHEINPHMDF